MSKGEVGEDGEVVLAPKRKESQKQIISTTLWCEIRLWCERGA
jgi:hypothetical protein